MRLLPLLVLLVACGDKTPDTGAPIDTGTGEDTDTAVDTDTGDTDTGDTDTGDSDTDTGDSDTDTDTDTDEPPVDEDGDGFLSDVDCNDRAPRVHPGADEVCDGLDNDCSNATSEDGTAAVEDASGAWTDVTAALASGTADLPSVVGDDGNDDVSVTGGTVHICAGTWNTKLVFADERTDIDVVAPAGAASTTLTTDGVSGGAPGSIVAVTNGTVRVEGFTIRGGAGSEQTTGSLQGGGVIVAQTSGTSTPASPNLTLVDSVVTGNEAEYGGGVAIRGYAWLLLEDSRVEDNTGLDAGGGVWIQDQGTLGCTASALGAAGVTENAAPVGGGVYLSARTTGNVDAVGCDWGEDADGDDNLTYDIQQSPSSNPGTCYPNATSLSSTVSCGAGTCTASTDASCP